jgi:phospholipid/cholesterol/gamma-HCH transport system substrate-binding protein
MDSNRNATKVGIFVFVGLALIAGLFVNFSKGASWFHSYYRINITSENVSGLKTGASVLLSGVSVGSVEGTTLAPDGRHVIITVRIFKQYVVREKSRFEIEQSGFLGDQFVSIVPADPWTFTPGDIADAAAFVTRLKHAADPVSAYLATRLSDATRQGLPGYVDGSPIPHWLQESLAIDLNKVVNGPPIFDGPRFSSTSLRPDTRQLASKDQGNEGLARLNRQLLEDAFPDLPKGQQSQRALADGVNVTAEAPFNLQEAARSAMGLLQKLDVAVDKINGTVTRVDSVLLSGAVLTNAVETVASLRRSSARAESAVAAIEGLIQSNSPAVQLALSNLNQLTLTLNTTATSLGGTLDALRPDLTKTLANASDASSNLKAMAEELQAGRGLAGTLLKDPAAASKVGEILTNISSLSGSLARYGIWRGFWRMPKDEKPANSSPR